MVKKWLSKSQIKLFLQCPLKWKFIYLDEIPSISSPQQNRGNDVHKKIENFYKKIRIREKDGKKEILVKENDPDLEKFVEFENKRLNEVKDLQSFVPLFQELKLADNELMVRGIIDAVYINPDDNKAIIIDWKTGNFNSNDIDDYRLELAIYKILLEKDKKNKLDVGYWGIFFTDRGKLFFEKVDEKYVTKTLKTIEKVRDEMENGDYKMKPSWMCRFCQFKDKCGGNNVNI